MILESISNETRSSRGENIRYFNAIQDWVKYNVAEIIKKNFSFFSSEYNVSFKSFSYFVIGVDNLIFSVSKVNYS